MAYAVDAAGPGRIAVHYRSTFIRSIPSTSSRIQSLSPRAVDTGLEIRPKCRLTPYH